MVKTPGHFEQKDHEHGCESLTAYLKVTYSDT